MNKTEDMILSDDHNEYLLRVFHYNEFCRPPTVGVKELGVKSHLSLDGRMLPNKTFRTRQQTFAKGTSLAPK